MSRAAKQPNSVIIIQSVKAMDRRQTDVPFSCSLMTAVTAAIAILILQAYQSLTWSMLTHGHPDFGQPQPDWHSVASRLKLILQQMLLQSSFITCQNYPFCSKTVFVCISFLVEFSCDASKRSRTH